MQTPLQHLSRKPKLYLKDFEYLNGVTSWQDAFALSKNMHDFTVLNDIVGALDEKDCHKLMCDIILWTVREHQLSEKELDDLGLLPFLPLINDVHAGTQSFRNNVDHAQTIWEETCKRTGRSCTSQMSSLVSAFFSTEAPEVYSSAAAHGHALRNVSWQMAWIVAHMRPNDTKSKKEVQVDELERQYARYKEKYMGLAANLAEAVSPTIPYEKQLSLWIRACEERFISYKKMLEEAHRDKTTFPPEDPAIIEYKESLRWSKNMEETRLKELREEKTYYPGMTPTQVNNALFRIKSNSDLNRHIASLESIALTYVEPEHKPFIDQLIAHLTSKLT